MPGVAAALATIELLESASTCTSTSSDSASACGPACASWRAVQSMPATVSGFGSVFVLCFMEPPLETYEDTLRNDSELFVRYRRELRRRGVFEMPENLGRSHLMYSHTDADVDLTLEAAEEALRSALHSPPA